MHLRRRRQVTTAGLAVCAVALAACSSSSSSSSSSSASAGTSSAPAAASSSNLSGTLNGSGSTFQTVFQESAIAAFRSVDSGITVNYGSGGSGKGRTDLASGVVNYAGSDSPIPAADVPLFKGKTVLYFPVHHRPDHDGVQPVRRQQPEADPDGHRRTSSTARSPEWNDPAIASINSGGQPAQHADHDRGPLGLLRAPRRTSPCSSRTPRASRVDARQQLDHQVADHRAPGRQRQPRGRADRQVHHRRHRLRGLSPPPRPPGWSSPRSRTRPAPTSRRRPRRASAAADGATVATNLTFAAAWAPGATAYPITYQSWDLVYAMQPNANDAALLKAWIWATCSRRRAASRCWAGLGYAPLPSNLDQMAVAQLSQITGSVKG